MTSAPLDLRVLTISRGVAGAFATRLLADLGARCSWWQWAAERPGDWPGGPLFRQYFEQGVEVVRQPATLPGLRRRLREVAADFDLMVSDFGVNELRAGTLERALRRANPAIVVANADHYGRWGPYAAWQGDELTDYALGGYWALAGDPEREPLRVPGHQAQFHAGLQLAIGALAACRHARRRGAGQDVEVSAVEAMLGAHWSTTVAWTHEGRILKRTGCDLFRATDGWVFFYRLGVYPPVFTLIGRPELANDPRWATVEAWRANAATIWAMVEEWAGSRTVREAVEAAQALRIPATPLATAASLLADQDLAERGAFRDDGPARLPGLPYRWSDPWDAAAPPAQLGPEHAGQQPRRPEPATAGKRTARPDDAPLAGIRVLELTNNWAGPVAARHLADLGADVIKIEWAKKPATRGSHYPGAQPGKYHWNRSGYFNEMNRNKRGLALDLSTPRGRELFLELVRQSDVVVENNAARVMPGLGLGYDKLRKVNPRLVMASICGFGATGRRRNWVAYGSNVEPAVGLAAITGYPGDGRPYRTGTFVADPIAGAMAALGVIAGIERRDRTGIGAHLDISLVEVALPFMLESLCHWQEHGKLMPVRGNADPASAPVGAYPCAGGDDWVAIAVRTDTQWAALCHVAGLDPSPGASVAERVARREEIEAALAAWTVGLDHYECARLLQAAGVPAAPILHNWELHSDPHLFHRRAFVPIEHPDTGVLPYPAFPWQFSQTKPAVRSHAPRFGQDNVYVLRERLGMSDADVVALLNGGVIADEPAYAR